MSAEEYKNLYKQVPPVDPAYQLALAAWCYYHHRCETFDRAHCSARMPDGTAIPVNGYEAASINWNARRIMKDINHWLDGVEKETYESAKRDAARMSASEHELGFHRFLGMIRQITG